MERKEIETVKCFNPSLALQWHVTNRCDQRCRHCYIYNKDDSVVAADEPTLDEARAFFDDFCAFCGSMGRVPSFWLTGGDPLLYPHIWGLLEYFKEKNTVFRIMGNPFHLTEEVCARLKKLGCAAYHLSLDGLEKTHDSFRKPGSFQATLRAIALLNNAGIKTSIMATVSKANYQEMPELARIVCANKASRFAFARYAPTHNDIDQGIEPSVYRDFLSEMWQVYNELKNQGTSFRLKDHLWKPFLYEEGYLDLPAVNGQIADGCHCATGHLTLLPDGAVYACRRFDSQVGNLKKEPFYYIWHNSQMNEYREVEKIAGCKDCELLYFCRGCPAVAAGTSGSFFSGDPQCWRRQALLN